MKYTIELQGKWKIFEIPCELDLVIDPEDQSIIDFNLTACDETLQGFVGFWKDQIKPEVYGYGYDYVEFDSVMGEIRTIAKLAAQNEAEYRASLNRP